MSEDRNLFTSKQYVYKANAELRSINFSPDEHRNLSILIIGRRAWNPLHRSKKSAWNTACLLGSDPEVADPVGAETCGCGDDGGDDVGDGGCWTPVTHFHPRCRNS